MVTVTHEWDVVIRYTPYPHVNRVATGFYNTEDEIGWLAGVIVEVRGTL